jgi:hypothetical protein
MTSTSLNGGSVALVVDGRASAATNRARSSRLVNVTRVLQTSDPHQQPSSVGKKNLCTAMPETMRSAFLLGALLLLAAFGAIQFSNAAVSPLPGHLIVMNALKANGDGRAGETSR